MSSALVGCVFGTIFAGLLSDKYGRKYPLLVSVFLYMVSAFGSGYVDTFSWVVFYRVLGGLGIGIASTLSPLYMAELAPGPFRDRFVSINQLTIVLGILAAQVINFLIAEPVNETMDISTRNSSWNSLVGWRWMFLAELIPASVFFLLMFTVPKSPRFLIKIGKIGEAARILGKIGCSTYAKSELLNIKKSLAPNMSKVQKKELFHPNVKPILVIGITLTVFQQWCGINVIFNYAGGSFH